MQKVLLLLLLLFTGSLIAQKQDFKGQVVDTSGIKPLQNAVIMSIKLKDSVLVGFARSDAQGYFLLKQMPVDTYQVIISHPAFSDRNYIIVSDTSKEFLDFGKVKMPEKSTTLDEVTILGYADPVYFKGDTLIYTADSFKVKPNATVEDLLKKLPGIRVDDQGKITAQGKEITQVLVDGDEFFGNDPTIATKNLNAKNVESVQVYDKANENISDQNTEETVKVMNLKLKEEAKKGYFGKASASGDFKKFYEGEFLANTFSNKRKLAIFGLATNTPKNGFNYQDIDRYGLSGEGNGEWDEDGESFFWTGGSQAQGIPKQLKTGFYFSDKPSKKTNYNLNYTYNRGEVNKFASTYSQYFLSDTSYKTDNRHYSDQLDEKHSGNGMWKQNLDSLTELTLTPKFSYSKAKINTYDTTSFYTASDSLSRATIVNQNQNSEIYDFSNSLRLKKNFKRKNRSFKLNYFLSYNQQNSENILGSNEESDEYALQGVAQKKESNSVAQSHFISTEFTEPFTLKTRMELVYDFQYSLNDVDKKTFDKIGDSYSSFNSNLSNIFRNTKVVNMFTLKYIYEVKKYRVVILNKFRELNIENNNAISGQVIRQDIFNLLPGMRFRYKFSDNSSYSASYTTNASQPSISQLQPIPDNSNPNSIRLGNPDLRPSFNQNLDMNFFSYKPLSNRSFWAGLNYTYMNNAFGSAISYDSLGRTISKPINVNGNMSGYAYFAGNLPLYKNIVILEPNVNANYSRNIGYINELENRTENLNLSGGTDIQFNKEKINFSIGGSIDYSIPKTTLNNSLNKPYYNQTYTADIFVELPKKFTIESEAEYTINQQRAQGYNINYIIWNLNITKSFFKRENLIVGIEANDILNQNISNQREVNNNVITDKKTTIIQRYILFKLTWKFNSNKTVEEEDEEYD